MEPVPGKVQKILKRLIGSDRLEDRREYDPEQLAHMYGLTLPEATRLHELIQAEF